MIKLVQNFSLILFPAIGLALVTFIVGVGVGILKLPPYGVVSDTIRVAKALRKEGLAYLGLRPVEHLRPLVFDRTGFSAPDSTQSSPGVTMLISIFDGGFTGRLYSRGGELLHEWPIDFFELGKEYGSYRFNALIHGAAMMPNGDLIANLDGRGMYRISRCGEIVWQNEVGSHHALFVDEDGAIWAPKDRALYEADSIYGWEYEFDRITTVDASTGEETREIDLRALVVDAGLEGLVTANRIHADDVLHLNDIEVLATEIADAFPMFDAGDILLNHRNLNQIWVLDGETHAIKWWYTGAISGAHDPDFQPDGTITVLDNRPGGPPGIRLDEVGRKGGSRILKIDPVSRSFETMYQSGEKSTFYTPFRGKHQILEGGNILIAETDRGRAIEVTPGGAIVWEYINAYDSASVVWMMDAIRYPESYADWVNDPCP